MPRSVRFDNGKALVPLGLIAERWIRDYWQLASGPRMPRQIHQNRELGFGTALERTMTKCRKLFKSTLNNRLHRNLACVIDKSSRGAKLERAFEELPVIANTASLNP